MGFKKDYFEQIGKEANDIYQGYEQGAVACF